ncbi:hypothetical protein ParKJ_06910 [Paraburkholderia fungorum]|uniref:Uncharacterized protein n=1 Tax=Paraburkholderia fungorum TaxID=134537 RepID=A0AAP5USI1_9BURK|nr:hypothetical protein [Paraburkholderia fungorum]MDT8837135.1 hypothetical protein [Paraburkholderia fungorum]PRZ53781.1 hypothetical protein BX589_109223 [Paraburkholderia fungorum]
MSDPSTFVLNSISDMQLTADGQYLLIHGNQPTAALHRSVLNDLLVALPNAIEHADRVIHNDREMGFALRCQGWEVGRLHGMEMVVIRFRLSGSAGLSFSLPAEQIPHLLQALGGAANAASAAGEASEAGARSHDVTLQ